MKSFLFATGPRRLYYNQSLASYQYYAVKIMLIFMLKSIKAAGALPQTYM